jgi:hypothetical protein
MCVRKFLPMRWRPDPLPLRSTVWPPPGFQEPGNPVGNFVFVPGKGSHSVPPVWLSTKRWKIRPPQLRLGRTLSLPMCQYLIGGFRSQIGVGEDVGAQVTAFYAAGQRLRTAGVHRVNEYLGFQRQFDLILRRWTNGHRAVICGAYPVPI